MEKEKTPHDMNYEQLMQFQQSSKDTLTLGPLHKEERKQVHEWAEKYNIKTTSYGQEPNRYMMLSKTGEILNISNKEREAFIRDSGLPIPSFYEKDFEYYLETLGSLYQTDVKYKWFLEALAFCKQHQTTFYNYSKNLMQQLINNIKSSPSFQNLSNLAVEPEILPNKYNLYPNIPFSKDTESWYISLDIKKANVTALLQMEPNILLGCATWEEFVWKYTPLEYFINSKYFRQVVINSLGCRSIHSIQKKIMSELYQYLQQCKLYDIAGRVSDDEIIIRTSPSTCKGDMKSLQLNLQLFPTHKSWRVTLFSLRPIVQIYDKIAYAKITDSVDFSPMQNEERVEIKNVEADFHSQVLKYYRQQPIQSGDLKAMKSGLPITYNTDIFSNLPL